MKQKTYTQILRYMLPAVLLTLLLISPGLTAQVTIGSDSPPQNYSILEIVSNQKGGLRLPQLTTAERDALRYEVSPGVEKAFETDPTRSTPYLYEGLTIFNTTTRCVEYYNAQRWISMCDGSSGFVNDCYDYEFPVTGGDKECTITDPGCNINGAYTFTIINGSSYASILVTNPEKGEFILTFLPSEQATPRNAIVLVTSPCGVNDMFVFTQNGDDTGCGSIDDMPEIIGSNKICNGGSVDLHLDGNLTGTFIWTLNGQIIGYGNSYRATLPGTYIVYRNKVGCSDYRSIKVSLSGDDAPDPLQIYASNNGIICGASGQVILTSKIRSNLVVQWYHNGEYASNKHGSIITLGGQGDAGDWYAINAHDGTPECASMPSNIITVVYNDEGVSLPIPIATVNGQPLDGSLTICKDGTLRLDVTNHTSFPPGTQYEWFDNGVSIAKSPNPVTYIVVPSSTEKMRLSLTATAQSEGCPANATSGETEVALTAPGVTSINNGALQAAVCGTTLATLTAGYSGAAAYEWIKDGEIVQSGTNSSYQTLDLGSYTVRYKDGNDCWSKVSTAIEVIRSAPVYMTWNPEPAGDAIKGGTYTYTVITSPQANQYHWSYGTSNAVESITPIGNGSSAVVVYNDNGGDVTITAKTVGYPCGDVTLSKDITVGVGCIPVSSVNIIPNGSLNITAGAIINFTASANVSDVETYEWSSTGGSPSTGTGETFNCTFGNPGTYTVKVKASKDCGGTMSTAEAEVSVIVSPNKDNYTEDTSGKFKLTGKVCFDIAQSNFDSNCGLQPQRPGDFLNTSRQWVEGKQWVYTFVATSGASTYSDLQFIADDPSVLLKSTTGNVSANPPTYTLVFDESVLVKALGKNKKEALTITIYALYKSPSGGAQKRVELKINVQDCMCCGAYVSAGVWKAFMCHNLGADESLDPFTPAKGLHGAKYKFGVKTATVNMADDQSNVTIPNWGSKPYVTTGPWTSTNDPCPDGYRLPKKEEWAGVVNKDLNTQEFVEPWTDGSYTSGMKFGDNLFLPAAGNRLPSGKLEERGIFGIYWSSDNNGSNVHYMSMSKKNVISYDGGLRTEGHSIRCISK